MADNGLAVYTLYSGSKANSTYIRYGGCEILIDAGASAAATERALNRLGSSLSDISAVFVTHEHSDHIRGLDVISKKYRIPVHMTSVSASRIYPGGALGGCVTPHPPIYSQQLGGLTVTSFVTPHDSLQCVGYRVSTPDGDVGVATDLGCVTAEVERRLSGCRYLVLECNHDRGMLSRGNYPPELKRRILSVNGHLSNDDCAECVARLAGQGANGVLLAHISRENNSPELALRTVRAALSSRGLNMSCLLAASQDEPTRLI